VIALAIVLLMAAIAVPGFLRARYATVHEARAFGYIEDAQIVDELGDTNGPYTLVGATVSGVGKPFDFKLTFNGRTTNWSQPVSNHMWFVVTVFENRRGNQFAVVRKRTD